MKRFVWVFVSFLLLSGCSEKPRYEIRMALNSWPGYEPLFLAKEMKLFGKTPPGIIRVHSNTDTVKALRSGILDVAALTMDEVLRMAQDVPDVSVFLILDISDGGDAIVGQEGIASMSDLKGRRIGVEAGALGAYVLTRAIEKTPGLSLSDLEIYPVTYKDHEEVFLSRAIDAVVTFEPVKSRLLEQGGSTLFDSSQIPNEILDVLVVRNEVARQYPEELRAIVAGWFAAMQFIKENPKVAFATMAGYEKISASLFESSYHSMRFPTLDENRRLLAQGNPGILDSVEQVKANLLKNKILIHPFPLAPLFSDRFLAKAVP